MDTPALTKPDHSNSKRPKSSTPTTASVGSSPQPSFSDAGQIRPGKDPGAQLRLPHHFSYHPELLLQPETRQITDEDLRPEIDEIYRGVHLLERKCIAFDSQQAITKQHLKETEWIALIGLHSSYLNECLDFMLASQHPAASQKTRELPTHYDLPKRMWTYGIHAFMEVLQMMLYDNSKEFMLRFAISAYSMLVLLVESVPTYSDIFRECLGDVSRYRMMIVDVDPEEHTIWAGIAQSWYFQLSNRKYTEGRIQHHLAVLAKGTLKQLFHFTKALVTIRPFPAGRANLENFCVSLMQQREANPECAIDERFGRIHASVYLRSSKNDFKACDNTNDEETKKDITIFMDTLNHYVGSLEDQWQDPGVYIVLINISALFDYGNVNSPLFKVYTDRMEAGEEGFKPGPITKMTFSVFSVLLGRIGDKNVLASIHTTLAFIWTLALTRDAIQPFEEYIPWTKICGYMNFFSKKRGAHGWGPRLLGGDFPHQLDHMKISPFLPEDFYMSGNVWSWFYYPKTFFDVVNLEDDERLIERPSMPSIRLERCLWLCLQLARVCEDSN